MIPVIDRVPTYPNRIRIKHEDGSTELVTWERADEPTVEGTPINKALFDSIAADIGAGLSANKTVYVSGAGSDALGDGTQTNPYATISKAVSQIPTNLNGYEAVINVATGTYNEDVLIENRFGGQVIIDGTASAAVNIRSLRVYYGSSVQIRNIALTVTGQFYGNGITVYEAALNVANDIAFSGVADVAVSANHGGIVNILGVLTSNGTTSAIVYAARCAMVFVSTINGTVASGSVIRAINGAKIAYSLSNVVADVAFATVSGGRIYTGAQTEIPKY